MLAWSDKFRIGVRELDSQHAVIFAMLAQFHGNVDENTSAEVIADMLQGLRDFAAFHLHFEEVYMERVGFPECEIHTRQHERLMETVERLVEDGTRLPLDKARAMEELLTAWFADHIFLEDAAIAAFVQRRAVPPQPSFGRFRKRARSLAEQLLSDDD